MITLIDWLIDGTAALLCRLLGMPEPPAPDAPAAPRTQRQRPRTTQPALGPAAARPEVPPPAQAAPPPHAPSRKVIDVRTCGCMYIWDRATRAWQHVHDCGALSRLDIPADLRDLLS